MCIYVRNLCMMQLPNIVRINPKVTAFFLQKQNKNSLQNHLDGLRKAFLLRNVASIFPNFKKLISCPLYNSVATKY